MERNGIYNILENKDSEALVLYGEHNKEEIIYFKEVALKKNIRFFNITKNIKEVHKFLTSSKSDYSKLLDKNDKIYYYNINDIDDMFQYLEKTGNLYLMEKALISGRFKNIKSVVKTIDKIGNIDLIAPKENDNHIPLSITLKEIIDYCPTIYTNGNGKNIEKIVDFLASKKILYLLQLCPSILLNKKETIEQIYNFLDLNIIIETPIVLTAKNIDRVKTMYKYGTDNKTFADCPSMVTFKEDNVKTNDEVLKDYGLNNKIATSVKKNNPNKVVKMLDIFIESDAYDAVCSRRSILNKKFLTVAQRIEVLKINNIPVQTMNKNKINPIIFASSEKFKNYQLNGRSDGFNLTLNEVPISREKSEKIKKERLSDKLFDILENTDIRNMEVSEEVLTLVNQYMQLLDKAYGVINIDGSVDELKYNVEGMIVSKNKVKRNLIKLFNYDINFKSYSAPIISAAIIEEMRLTGNQIVDILGNIISKKFVLKK